jgi:hypothetical protein
VWNANALSSSSSSSTAVCPDPLLHFYAALWTRTWTVLLEYSCRCYADIIDTSRDWLAWLAERGLKWEAAVEDADEKGVPVLLPTSSLFRPTMLADANEKGVTVNEYMANIKANMEKFALSDTIFDRKELLSALRDAFTDKGQFVLLLGGKSVGKSYVLKTLKKPIQQCRPLRRKRNQTLGNCT